MLSFCFPALTISVKKRSVPAAARLPWRRSASQQAFRALARVLVPHQPAWPPLGAVAAAAAAAAAAVAAAVVVEQSVDS